MKFIQKKEAFKSPQDAIISYVRGNGYLILVINLGVGYIQFLIGRWKIKISTLRY